MAIQISKVDVWAGKIKDRPGGLSVKLEALADAGASLEFLISRRAPDRPGTGVVFLAPLRGARQARVAKLAGLSKATTMHSLRVEGPDRPGLGAKITHAIADAGINMRGFSAAALGRRCVFYLAFDKDADAKKASRLLKRTFAAG
ncbi:MAG: ACT domain-containing protein [Planctomycetota bacterium]|jgi:hypothetical protein